MSERAARVRADVWLWRARFFKTRTAAARAIEEGEVRLERAGRSHRLAKPAETVGPGDGLSVRTPGGLRSVEVLGCGERRGPAAEARLLYRERGAPEDSDGEDDDPSAELA